MALQKLGRQQQVDDAGTDGRGYLNFGPFAWIFWLFEFWAVCLDILVIHEILAQLIGHEFNSLVQNLRVCKLTENNSLFSFFFFSCFFNQD
jgi:hypothetical protein